MFFENYFRSNAGNNFNELPIQLRITTSYGPKNFLKIILDQFPNR